MITMTYDSVRGPLITSNGTELCIPIGSPVMGSRALTRLLDMGVDNGDGFYEVTVTPEAVACFNEIRMMLEHPTVNTEVVEALFDNIMRGSNARSISERSVFV